MVAPCALSLKPLFCFLPSVCWALAFESSIKSFISKLKESFDTSCFFLHCVYHWIEWVDMIRRFVMGFMVLCVFSMVVDATAAEKPALIQGERPEDVQLVLLGDSITDNFHKSQKPNQNFSPIFKKFYAPFHAVNFGKSGYTTAEVTRLLETGLLDHLTPKLVYLLIGTNDTMCAHSVENTVRDIQKLEAVIHQKLPQAHLLIIGILPSDAYNWRAPGSKDPAGKWKADREINRLIAQFYRGNPKVTILDVGKVLLSSNGKVNANLFFDPKEIMYEGKPSGPLHPDTVGQRKVAEAIQPTLLRLMRKK